MTNKQKFVDKIDEFIALADVVIKSGSPNRFPQDSSSIREFRGSVETFIVSIYGVDSPFHKNFKLSMQSIRISGYEEAKGLLLGVRKHIDQGWLESERNRLSAEIFSDYLEMAEYLNEEGFYIAAAVIAGSTLEERLKQLCVKYSLPTEAPDRSGTMKPIKADGLNSSLSQLYTDGKNDQKQVTKNYGLRNDAAHGVWNNDSPQQKQHRKQTVEFMIREIRLFIKSNPL